MSNTDFRIHAVERAVSRGSQGRADLDAVKAHGVVTKPASSREARSLCLTLAAECAVLVEAGRRSKREL